MIEEKIATEKLLQKTEEEKQKTEIMKRFYQSQQHETKMKILEAELALKKKNAGERNGENENRDSLAVSYIDDLISSDGQGTQSVWNPPQNNVPVVSVCV